MKVHKKNTYLMLGFPASGKTTFLAALTATLNAYAEQMKLHKKKGAVLEGFSLYLEEQAKKWMSFEEVERTYKDSKECISFDLTDDEGKCYYIKVPDISGEVCNDMVKERYVEKDLVEKIRSANVILLFINLENSRNDSKLITEMPQDIQEGMGKGSEKVELNADEMIFQSKIVELLQIIQYIKRNLVRMKIVLSAWDSVEACAEDETIRKTPVEVLKSEFPMVFEFIINNREWLIYELWGISAQGCDLNNAQAVEKMSQLGEAIDRITVVNENGERSCDLSEILLNKGVTDEA